MVKQFWFSFFALVWSCLAFTQDTGTLERAELFAKTASLSGQDRRLPDTASSLAALNLTATFTSTLDASGLGSLRWTLKNTGSATLNGLQLSVLLDPDLNAGNDTYFNEYGEHLSLVAPNGELSPTAWEIDELGYQQGQLWAHAKNLALTNLSTLDSARTDDAAAAFAFAPISLAPDQTTEISVLITASGSSGLKLSNLGTSDVRVLNASQKVAATALPPQVALTNPASGQVLIVGQTTRLTASASSPNTGGSIAKVEFFADALKLGEVSQLPYAFDYTPTAPGSVTLRAVATDNRSVTTSSALVVVSVQAADSTPDAFSFVPVANAPLSSLQTSNEVVLAGLNTEAAISISTGEYQLNGGAFTSAPGMARVGDRIIVRQTASDAYATTSNAALTVGGVSASFAVTTRAAPADTTPDPFTFAPVTDAALSSVQTSNEITVAGINAATPISVAGGTYQINGGAFTSSVGTVVVGDRVRVRLTASANNATATTSTLNIGGVTAEFTATTLAAADTTPDPFTFVPVTNAALSSVQTSNEITLAGINAASPISINGGTYQINDGAFTSTAGTVVVGDRVRIRLTASAVNGTATTSTLTIGGVSGGFTATTVAAGPVDTTPDAFSFTPVSNAPLSSVQASNEITVAGINAASPISITGGSYQINGGAFTSTAGTVVLGDTVRVRLTTSASNANATTTSLSIGGVSGGFTATTVAAGPVDTTPDAFSFTPVTNAPLSSVQTSNEITVAGINAASPISTVAGTYQINDGAFTSTAGTVVAGDRVRIRLTASAANNTATTSTLNIGGVSGGFTATTVAAGPVDTTPDAFSFTPVTNAPLSSVQVSSEITVAGINAASPISITGGSYQINGGAFTSGAGTVVLGDRVRVRVSASASNSATTTSTLDIGGVTGAFNVTTLASSGGASCPAGAVTLFEPGQVVFTAFDALERLEGRGGRVGAGDWEFGLGRNTQNSALMVNGHVNWLSATSFRWTLSVNAQGIGEFKFYNPAGELQLTLNYLPNATRLPLRLGNALQIYAKVSAGLGTAKVNLVVTKVNGFTTSAAVATLGNNLFSDARKTIAHPDLSGGMNVEGTIQLDYIGPVPTGSRLNWTITSGNAACAN